MPAQRPPAWSRQLQHHFQSTVAVPLEQAEAEESEALPTVTDPAVRTHLLFIASLVFSIVVVGGLTRLTESGLSITEWELVTGVTPPLGEDAWKKELDKYRLTPEGRLCV